MDKYNPETSRGQVEQGAMTRLPQHHRDYLNTIAATKALLDLPPIDKQSWEQ